MNLVLTNRKWQIDGNWYAPSSFLGKFKSVLFVELIDTTSSAGDWNGLFFQLINGMVYVIPYFQSNNYPGSGFTLQTGDVFYSFNYPTYNETIKNKLISDYCEMQY